MLDSLSGVEREGDGPGLRDLVRRSLHPLRSASVVGVVVGSTVDASALRAACGLYGSDVSVLAFRCLPGSDLVRQQVGNVSVIGIGELDDLARLFAVLGAVR